MNRRGFLGAILAAGVAPAFPRAGSLMRIVTRTAPAGWVIGAGGFMVPGGLSLQAISIFGLPLDMSVAALSVAVNGDQRFVGTMHAWDVDSVAGVALPRDGKELRRKVFKDPLYLLPGDTLAVDYKLSSPMTL